jgi:hypothetical protein
MCPILKEIMGGVRAYSWHELLRVLWTSQLPYGYFSHNSQISGAGLAMSLKSARYMITAQ